MINGQDGGMTEMAEKQRIWVILETEDPEELVFWLNENLEKGEKVVDWNGMGEEPNKDYFETPKPKGDGE